MRDSRYPRGYRLSLISLLFILQFIVFNQFLQNLSVAVLGGAGVRPPVQGSVTERADGTTARYQNGDRTGQGLRLLQREKDGNRFLLTDKRAWLLAALQQNFDGRSDQGKQIATLVVPDTNLTDL